MGSRKANTSLLVYAHRSATAELHVNGNRVLDLQIALCAFEGGARELWSRDVRFVTIPGLRRVSPLA